MLSHWDFGVLCYCSVTYTIILLLCIKCQGGTKEEVLSTLFPLLINRTKWVIISLFSPLLSLDWRTRTNIFQVGRGSLPSFSTVQHPINSYREKYWEQFSPHTLPASMIYDRCPWWQEQSLGMTIYTPHNFPPVNWVKDKIWGWNE